ncbi:MAG: hypothetical protein ACR2NW_03530 [Thermodesulfobacteriota bacterium]
MELIGKFLFLILFSVSIGAGAVYVVGPTFFTSDLDSNLFDGERQQTSTVNVNEYRKKLRADYDEYNRNQGTKVQQSAKDYEPIWEDAVDYRR